MDILRTTLSDYLLHKCQSTIHEQYTVHTTSMKVTDRPWILTRCWRRVEQSRKVIVKYKCARVVRIYLKIYKTNAAWCRSRDDENEKNINNPQQAH